MLDRCRFKSNHNIMKFEIEWAEIDSLEKSETKINMSVWVVVVPIS